MEAVLLMNRPREIVFQEYEPTPLEPGHVRVRTLYSGVSAGTEMTIYRGSNPYAHKRWSTELKLFLPESITDKPDLYPCPVGYEEVGEVVEVGKEVQGVSEGELV